MLPLRPSLKVPDCHAHRFHSRLLCVPLSAGAQGDRTLTIEAADDPTGVNHALSVSGPLHFYVDEALQDEEAVVAAPRMPK